jgi:hypothetical protein
MYYKVDDGVMGGFHPPITPLMPFQHRHISDCYYEEFETRNNFNELAKSSQPA